MAKRDAKGRFLKKKAVKKVARKAARVSTGKGSDVVVVNAPAPITRTQSRRRAPAKKRRAPVRRRSSGGGGSASWEPTRSEKYTLGGALLLGWVQKTNPNIIPKLFNLTPEASAGLILYMAGRWGKMQLAREMAPGVLAIALHRWAAGTVPAGYVVGDDGQLYVVGDDGQLYPYDGVSGHGTAVYGPGDDDDDLDGDDDDDDFDDND